MSNYAIRVNNLGKMYRIGGPQDNQQTFREAIMKAAGSPFKKARDLMRGQAYAAGGLNEEVWALKDISFDVKHGEVLGFIGRNGAGKSTLLKILSRITDPSEGYADVYGRVGALLEVGTGFHQELSGRENVYLNGAILGMDRGEIDKKFDEMVDFAGVEKFIDTPVKHYSSGMRLRLGFAVAAHLEPDILVVDEVLAVGDAEFQKKCLGKMSDVASQGRTVLFVSHNMGAVSSICERAILLQHGQIIFDNLPDTTIQKYLASDQGENKTDLTQILRHEGTGDIRFSSIRILNNNHDVIDAVGSGQGLIVELGYETTIDVDFSETLFRIMFTSIFGQRLFVTTTDIGTLENSKQVISGSKKTGKIYCSIPRLPLMPGQYNIDVECKGNINANRFHYDKIVNAYTLQVIEGDFFGQGKLPPPMASILVDHKWTLDLE